jgi:ABC-type multidrug transport system fused ATPase/permease subunit
MNEAVSKLTGQLEVVIEESSLSRGEKQLLCMARVLLQRRQIVILDEATSS